jgi:antitoxin component YwqK of YwqJK toxin-antitoxin module
MNKQLLFFIMAFFVAGINNAVAQKSLLCGFKNGLQEGTCKSFYENGQLENSVEWDKGKMDGEAFYYYKDGKMQAEGKFKKGFKTGEWKYYAEQGYLSSVSTYKVIENTQNLHGVSTFFYASGKKKAEENMKENKPDGEAVGYFENGNVSYRSTYSNGKIVGDSYNYYESDGALYSKGPAAISDSNAFLKTGKWYYYYEDGKTVMDTGEYEKDLPSGKWQGFHKNGKLKAESTYVNGKREGKRLQYNENGQLIKTEEYKQGELIK